VQEIDNYVRMNLISCNKNIGMPYLKFQKKE